MRRIDWFKKPEVVEMTRRTAEKYLRKDIEAMPEEDPAVLAHNAYMREYSRRPENKEKNRLRGRIHRLRSQGKFEEARLMDQEYRKKYPDRRFK